MFQTLCMFLCSWESCSLYQNRCAPSQICQLLWLQHLQHKPFLLPDCRFYVFLFNLDWWAWIHIQGHLQGIIWQLHNHRTVNALSDPKEDGHEYQQCLWLIFWVFLNSRFKGCKYWFIYNLDIRCIRSSTYSFLWRKRTFESLHVMVTSCMIF